MTTVRLDKVISRDGTPIAYYRSGAGSPLVLVAGAGAANPTAWSAVIPVLAQHFTVYAVERRGRGESGDGPSYAIQREFEDIAAVVNALGEPADLFGHSYGALCSLGAALLTRNIRKLVLYEPAGILAYPDPQGFIERLEKLLDAGDREGALITHYQEDAGLAPQEIEQMKSSPLWPARLATAHTLPRELRAEAQYRFEAQRFQDLRTPTLLLLGGDSPPIFQETAETLNAVLPNSQISVMPGQKHVAMYTAPDLFLQTLLAFFSD